MQKFFAPAGNVPTNSSLPTSSPNKNPLEYGHITRVFRICGAFSLVDHTCGNTWYFSLRYRGPMSLDRRSCWTPSVVSRCFGPNSWDWELFYSRRYHFPGDRAWHICFIHWDTETTTFSLKTGTMSLSVVFGSPEGLFLLYICLSWWIWLGGFLYCWHHLGSTLFLSYFMVHRLFSRWAGSLGVCFRTERVLWGKIYPGLWDSFQQCLWWSGENQT